MKGIIGFFAVVFIFISAIIACIYYSIPNYSRKGKKVLIHSQDTGIILREEKIRPFSILENRKITVTYRDQMGVYHIEDFNDFELYEIK